MKMFSTRVLGTGQDERDVYIRKHVRAGDQLKLELNPDHARDESGVTAYHGLARIGHVQADARWVRESLEEGDKLEVVVEGFDQSAKNLASVDIKIGVIDALLAPSTAARIENDPILQKLRDELLAMILIAKADDRMVKSEREIILRFAEERAKDFGLKFESGTADSLHKWIKRQDPTEIEIMKMIDATSASNHDKLRAIYEVSEIVTEMDGVLKPGEDAVLKRVQAKLKAKLG